MSTKDGFPRWLEDACTTPDIVRITVIADFWFLIPRFSGIIELKNLYIGKLLYGEMLYGEMLLSPSIREDRMENMSDFKFT